MRVIAKSRLCAFWHDYPESEQPLLAWYRETVKDEWGSPKAVKLKYRNAIILGGCRAVFNIKSDEYRLVVKINYPFQAVQVRFVGTHEQYEQIDAGEV